MPRNSISAEEFKIQFKRTAEGFTDGTNKENVKVDYGEPIYVDDKDYLIVGEKYTSAANQKTIGTNKVIKAVNRVATNDGTTYQIADNPVFFNQPDVSSQEVDLLDQDANKLYPKTVLSAISDASGTYNAAVVIANKVDIDSQSTADPFPSLGHDANGVYVDTKEEPTASDGINSLIAKKVSIDNDSSNLKPLSMGRDMVGTFIRTAETGDEDATNYLKSYVNRQIAIATANYTEQILNLQNAIASLQILVVDSSAPEDTNKLWLDTDNLHGGLKYYNGDTWKHVPVAYT